MSTEKESSEKKEKKYYDKLVDKAESVARVGLGYVGMPIAVRG